MANAVPSRLVDSVNGLIGKVKLLILKTVTFNIITPSLLEFKDQDGGLLDDVNIGIPNVENLQDSLDGKVDDNQVLTNVPANALFTDTIYDENLTVIRVLIPTSALPVDFTITDVKNWLNANESIGDSEILFWETTGDTVIVTLAVNITNPTEGQEITGDVNITFELFNESSINIITPTEGQSITGDVNITFEII